MKFELFAGGDDYRVALRTENNEAGVKAFTTHVPNGGFYAEAALEGQMRISAEEGRTIYFALMAQRDSIIKDIAAYYNGEHDKQSETSWHEDLMFLGEILMKVTKLLFAMCDDHEEEYKKVVTAWLNV